MIALSLALEEEEAVSVQMSLEEEEDPFLEEVAGC
jgi:hypothetical protein